MLQHFPVESLSSHEIGVITAKVFVHVAAVVALEAAGYQVLGWLESCQLELSEMTDPYNLDVLVCRNSS